MKIECIRRQVVQCNIDQTACSCDSRELVTGRVESPQHAYVNTPAARSRLAYADWSAVIGTLWFCWQQCCHWEQSWTSSPLLHRRLPLLISWLCWRHLAPRLFVGQNSCISGDYIEFPVFCMQGIPWLCITQVLFQMTAFVELLEVHVLAGGAKH